MVILLLLNRQLSNAFYVMKKVARLELCPRLHSFLIQYPRLPPAVRAPRFSEELTDARASV